MVLALFDSLPRTKITMSSSWASCYRWGKGLRWKKPNKKTRNVVEVWAMVGRNMIGTLGVRMTSHSRQVEVAQTVTMGVLQLPPLCRLPVGKTVKHSLAPWGGTASLNQTICATCTSSDSWF